MFAGKAGAHPSDLHSVVFQQVVIHGHEDDVDRDAQRDEQLGERVKYLRTIQLVTFGAKPLPN
jgi:hypothetical protein